MLLYLTVWFLALILFFTIPNSKKARYIIAITPAISLLAAYIFIDKSDMFSRARNWVLGFCLKLPAIGVGLALAVMIYNCYASEPLKPNYIGVFTSFAILTIVRYFMDRNYYVHPIASCSSWPSGSRHFLPWMRSSSTPSLTTRSWP